MLKYRSPKSLQHRFQARNIEDEERAHRDAHFQEELEKISKSSQTSFFSFLLQFLDYYMMILKLSIYIEIETDRLETTSLMSMTPKKEDIK
jgi:hypothetical protein